ncbi:MAG: hypothetical protein WD576_04845 [Nitriliruptoraceae bacterium]
MLDRRERFAAWVAPLVLVALAVTQLSFAATRDLTPWKGGGFGMFASVDRLNYRAMQVTIITDDGTYPVDIHAFAPQSRGTQTAFVNARALFDQRRVQHLIDQMWRAEWVIDRDVATFESWRDDDGGVGTPLPLRHRGHDDIVDVRHVDWRLYAVAYNRGWDEIRPRIVGQMMVDGGGRNLTVVDDELSWWSGS